MPPYLSLSFQCSKKKINEQTVHSFCDTLFRGGLAFAGGCLESKGESYDEIVCWNQRKLEENFELGPAEHFSQDYKQMLFRYMDYSEIRLFIMNEQKQTFFSFELIIPEEDFFVSDADHGRTLRMDRLEKMENLAAFLWKNGAMDCIQAGWELAEAPVSYADIAAGAPPLIDPFCIIPKSMHREQWSGYYRDVGRDGVCIRDVGRFHAAE